MASDPNEPVVLISMLSEAEAATLIAALDAYGITAQSTGGLTSGFKAEAPGDVRVLVRQSDLERAKTALAEIRSQAESGEDNG